MLDNIEVAILTKLNDLAERYGLKPYDFLATVTDDGEAVALRFEVHASGNALREDRYEKMLQALGISDVDISRLIGEEIIIDALDHALQTAPKHRPRF